MNKLNLFVFLIAVLISSCSSMSLEVTVTPTSVPHNTDMFSSTVTLPTSTISTEIYPEEIKCEDSGHTTDAKLFEAKSYKMIHAYFGTMDKNNEPIGLTLAYSGLNVEGRFFYTNTYKNKSDEMKVQGCLEKDRSFTLYIYNDNSVMAVFRGEFPEIDPNGGYGGSKLEREVIIGSWENKIMDEQTTIYLNLHHGLAKSFDNIYEVAGVEDDQVIDNAAQELLSAVARDDRETISLMMAYPIVVANIDGERKQITNQSEFLMNYEKIFTIEFKAILADTRPHHMFSNWQGIMLGNGDIWFNTSGKIVTINNYDS